MSLCNKTLILAALVAVSGVAISQESEPPLPKGPVLSDAIRKNITLENYISAQRLALSVEVAKANAVGMVLEPPPKPAPVPKAKPVEAPPVVIAEPTLMGAFSGPDARFVADVTFEDRTVLVRPLERIPNSPWIMSRGAVVGSNIEATFTRDEIYSVLVNKKSKKMEQRVRQVQITTVIPMKKD